MIVPAHADDRRQPIDWWAVDKSLLDNHGITPRQVDGMTMSEISLALEEAGPRPFAGLGQLQTEEEYLRSVLHWQSLSEREKLLYAAGRL